MMEKAIETGDALMERFFYNGRFGGERAEQMLEKGVFVDGKVRKDILTSTEQGRITIEGRVRQIEFENTGGGVYRAFVSA